MIRAEHIAKIQERMARREKEINTLRARLSEVRDATEADELRFQIATLAGDQASDKNELRFWRKEFHDYL
jgi:hypothetical protein